MSSNSSTAGSHPYSTDMEESTFLKRNRLIHWARFGLSVLITIAAIAAVACEAVPLRHYNDTSKWSSDDLPLWPVNFDLRPTIAALACGCVITALNLVYVVAALLPSVSTSATLSQYRVTTQKANTAYSPIPESSCSTLTQPCRPLAGSSPPLSASSSSSTAPPQTTHLALPRMKPCTAGPASGRMDLADRLFQSTFRGIVTTLALDSHFFA